MEKQETVLKALEKLGYAPRSIAYESEMPDNLGWTLNDNVRQNEQAKAAEEAFRKEAERQKRLSNRHNRIDLVEKIARNITTQIKLSKAEPRYRLSSVGDKDLSLVRWLQECHEALSFSTDVCRGRADIDVYLGFMKAFADRGIKITMTEEYDGFYCKASQL